MKEMQTVAALLGITLYIENGRVKAEAPAAELIRMWAMTGADVACDHDGKLTKSWEVRIDGRFAALILKDKSNGYAYTYTAIT